MPLILKALFFTLALVLLLLDAAAEFRRHRGSWDEKGHFWLSLGLASFVLVFVWDAWAAVE